MNDAADALFEVIVSTVADLVFAKESGCGADVTETRIMDAALREKGLYIAVSDAFDRQQRKAARAKPSE